MIKKLGVFKDFTDDSLKSVFDIGDNKIIEMTLLFNKEYDVVCVPTHHFCNLGCKMCHLTNNKLNKKMIPIKKEEFYKCLIDTLKVNGKKRTNKDKLLISFMGVGEPLLNFQLIKDIFLSEDKIKKELNYEEISYALATMMPNKNIEKITKEVNELNMPLKIHFSLHTPIDEDRIKLIPSTKVNINEALTYLINYKELMQSNKKIMHRYTKIHRNNIPIEIHYTLIDKINDTKLELEKLYELLKVYNIPIKFIKFNPKEDLSISKKEKQWIEYLNNNVKNIKIKTYTPPGREIGSSCGEFTKHYYHEEIETKEELEEFINWKKVHQIFE